MQGKQKKQTIKHGRIILCDCVASYNWFFLHRDTIANRDSSITERDTNIMNLQKQADAVTDQLKVSLASSSFISCGREVRISASCALSWSRWEGYEIGPITIHP